MQSLKKITELMQKWIRWNFITNINHWVHNFPSSLNILNDSFNEEKINNCTLPLIYSGLLKQLDLVARISLGINDTANLFTEKSAEK